jgi:2,3-bisphosphoglycerate-independent phosphoglycerate mutase
MSAPAKSPVALIIMDGWGINPEKEYNAIAQAGSPNIDELKASYPHTEILCSGKDVGLPPGIMGNSEVGHLNLGAGRVVWQDITRIDRAIADGDFFENQALSSAMARAKKAGSQLHLMGLTSDGCVHSCDRHYKALLEMARDHGLSRQQVCFHAILDGRDTPPKSGIGFLKTLSQWMQEIGVGHIVTVSGRFWAMDRDKRWERVEKFYQAITSGQAEQCTDPLTAVQNAYHRDETDEFVAPTKICAPGGQPLGLLDSGDEIIFFNYRADRAREICHALINPDFNGFQRKTFPAVTITGLTKYQEGLDTQVAFPKQNMNGLYADVLASAGKSQFRTAETEKYAHVTFFFNGGVEKPWPLEDRLLVPSPKVNTYDLQPEMSAEAVANAAIESIKSGKYDALIMNFANGDMVGHTGIMEAAVKAVRTVDQQVGRVVKALLETGGQAFVTADHGNCEQMWDPASQQPHTAHSTNPVPGILVSKSVKGKSLRSGGRLADIAPTLIELLGLDVSPEMDGRSLLQQ